LRISASGLATPVQQLSMICEELGRVCFLLPAREELFQLFSCFRSPKCAFHMASIVQSAMPARPEAHSLARAMAIAPPPEIEALGLTPDRLAERIFLTVCKSGTASILVNAHPSQTWRI
jgi:hypothetical protein